CYDAALDFTDSNTIIVGTEYGVYASFNNGSTWSEQNTGMARVAVYSIKQYLDQKQGWTGSKYYLGTFGRGMFESNSLLTGIKTNTYRPLHEFKVFPNPAANLITLEGLHSG